MVKVGFYLYEALQVPRLLPEILLASNYFQQTSIFLCLSHSFESQTLSFIHSKNPSLPINMKTTTILAATAFTFAGFAAATPVAEPQGRPGWWFKRPGFGKPAAVPAPDNGGSKPDDNTPAPVNPPKDDCPTTGGGGGGGGGSSGGAKDNFPFVFTSTYSVIATPDQVINGTVAAPGEPGARGIYNYGINTILDVICYVSNSQSQSHAPSPPFIIIINEPFSFQTKLTTTTSPLIEHHTYRRHRRLSIPRPDRNTHPRRTQGSRRPTSIGIPQPNTHQQ